MYKEHKIKGKIIPIGEKTYAYQDEPVQAVVVLKGRIPRQRGKQEYLNDEKDKIDKYELKIENHTANSLIVTLSKFRTDIVEQRKENGEAIKIEHFQFGISFAELVNKIFEGQEVLE